LDFIANKNRGVYKPNEANAGKREQSAAFDLGETMRPKAPFRLLYNNDTTNTAGVVSPWHEEGVLFDEGMLVASIEEVADTGVDAYMLSPGMGWVPWWQSDIEPDFYEWWKQRTGLEVAGPGGRGYDAYVYRGGDMVSVLVETCRKHGMAPFVSLRLNDVHHQELYEQKNRRSLVSCRFYTEHPEWHIDPDHRDKEGYYKQRGMDWSVPEVRAYKLALLAELAEKYDLAGLELDFLRDDTLFREGEVDEATRIDIITDFVAQVRAVLDRGGQDRMPRYLGVRIPMALAYHAETGLKVQRLREVGVDMFNLSSWYHTTQQSDVARVRDLVPDAAIYIEMTHSTGWHPYFMKPGLYGTNGDPRTSDHQFYTTALLAHQRGADGLSLFNFVYYRMGHESDVPVMEPPFHVLPKLKDTEFLARQSFYFMISASAYDRQLPKELLLNQPVRFTLDMLPPPRNESNNTDRPCRLRVHTEHELVSEHSITVRFNGKLLDASPDTSRFFGNPFDLMISPQSNRRAWLLPEELINDGPNDLQVELEKGQPVNVVYVDIGVPH